MNKPLKVLIACERSGVVRRAFRALGHNAWSCDLVPADDGSEYHITGDVLKFRSKGMALLDWNWDLLIAHPPCTRLSLSGNRWCVDHWVIHPPRTDAKWHDGTENRLARQKASEFFRALLNCNIPKRVIENPMSRASSLVAPKNQTIHPWQFGHPEQKETWLWLRNVQPLTPTKIVYDEMMQLPKAQRERIWSMKPGPDRERARSETYAGIAMAMAEQWGGYTVNAEVFS